MVVRRDEPIRGTTTAQKGSRPHRVEGDRICADGACSTRLSTYNPSPLCWVHEPRRPFVLDGVRPRKDRPVEPSQIRRRVA